MEIARQTVEELLASIGARTPSPGGGAAAALGAALGAALAEMVVRFSAGRKSLAAHDALHRESLAALEALRSGLLEAADADAAAYARLNELGKLDEGDARRRRELPAAIDGAIAVPERVLGACLELLARLERLAGRTSPMLASDLAVAAVLGEAGARAAAWNVRINLPLLADADRRDALAVEIDRRTGEAARMAARVERACRGPA